MCHQLLIVTSEQLLPEIITCFNLSKVVVDVVDECTLESIFNTYAYCSRHIQKDLLNYYKVQNITLHLKIIIKTIPHSYIVHSALVKKTYSIINVCTNCTTSICTEHSTLLSANCANSVSDASDT